MDKKIKNQFLKTLIKIAETSAEEIGIDLKEIEIWDVKDNHGRLKINSGLGEIPINYLDKEKEIVFVIKRGENPLVDSIWEYLAVNHSDYSLSYIQ